MAIKNVKSYNERRTHEGAMAHPINKVQELRRSVMACLLWEDQFYENGVSIADRIKSLVAEIGDNDVIKDIAREARIKQKLRHVPLLIARELARKPKTHISRLLYDIIQRPDELTEFLAIYWMRGKQPLAAQVKKGLADAFTKFDAYQLAKYDRKRTVNLKDVLFLTHAKPKGKEQEETWKKLIDGILEPPDTWEVALSSGADKKNTWIRLMNENRLGGMALLRNLRNMLSVNVPVENIKTALDRMRTGRILPYRFIAAARYAPQLESDIEKAMMKCLNEMQRLDGKTVFLIDVSGSMDVPLSSKSEMTRIDAACGLAIILRELADCRVFTFSEKIVEIPARRGFALRDAIKNSQSHMGTYLGKAVKHIDENVPYDRFIVISDEQSHDKVVYPDRLGYMLNVASYQNGVGYGKWTHIDGWSEAVIDYIRESEKFANQ